MNKGIDKNEVINATNSEENIEVVVVEIRMEEVDGALKKLYNWKVPGPEGIFREMLKIRHLAC